MINAANDNLVGEEEEEEKAKYLIPLAMSVDSGARERGDVGRTLPQNFGVKH